MMKIALTFLLALGMAGAALSAHVDDEIALAPGLQEQQAAQERANADNLYNLVKQARADLREMRVRSGLPVDASRPQASRRESHEGVEGAGEHRGPESRAEGGGRGGLEHGASRPGGDEEEGAYMSKMTKQDKLFANGARLGLQFDPATQVFVGSVTNTTTRTLPQVRVEVHLDNGTELGPTRRIDVGPGETVPVQLGAFGNDFSAWVSHPEAGIEAGHGTGGEEGGEEGREEGGEGAIEHGGREGPGEHGGGEAARPSDAAYRPVYNQLQILRGEMHAFEADLAARSR